MAAIIRIILRYATFPLLALGLILPEEQQALIADPEIVEWTSTGLGIISPIIAEGWYYLAKRLGWGT